MEKAYRRMGVMCLKGRGLSLPEASSAQNRGHSESHSRKPYIPGSGPFVRCEFLG